MKNGKFQDKVVVVTGGARGIGKNIASAFFSEGATVIICDINKNMAKKTVMELQKAGASVESLYVDLNENGASQKMIKKIFKKWKRIDVLVNNARAGKRLGLLEENEKNWDDSLFVGLKSAFFASQEVVRCMAKTGGGSIINISSVSALLTCHESPSYHVSKAGLLQMTRYLASHAGHYDVRVNAVLPGFIVQDEHKERYESDGNSHYRKVAEFCHPIGKVGTSDSIASVVLFLCSKEASFISGQCITVDGGLTLQEPSSLISRFDMEKK